MHRLTKCMRLLDFSVGIGSIAWGIWLGITRGFVVGWIPLFWLTGGVLGVALALWNPADRLRRLLEKRLVKRPVAAVSSQEAFPLPPKTPYSPSTKSRIS
jgi:hypothetical protein